MLSLENDVTAPAAKKISAPKFERTCLSSRIARELGNEPRGSKQKHKHHTEFAGPQYRGPYGPWSDEGAADNVGGGGGAAERPTSPI